MDMGVFVPKTSQDLVSLPPPTFTLTVRTPDRTAAEEAATGVGQL